VAHRVDQPCTLVAFLGARFPEMKKGTIKDRLRDGAVLVNGTPEHKATRALVVGDTVALGRAQAQRPTAAQAALAGIEILHVDGDLLVIHKPSGLLTVSTGSGGPQQTVLNVLGPWLRQHERQHERHHERHNDRPRDRLFPCHRLDEGTSGVLLLPRRPEVQQWFFAHWGKTEKTYVAVVEGVIVDDHGTIDAPLLEDPRTFSVRVVDHPDAREAVTHWRVLARGAQTTLVELVIDTGRKHQIRVHLQHLGHPVVGDERYGQRRAPRLCLHARQLVFPHPGTGQRLTFQAPVPALFQQLVTM
jgi:23S rRNA pseudouridine1911/1915/1917 synthase